MEQNNCLGIYLSRSKATAVLLSSNAAHPAVLGSFSIAKETPESADGAPPHDISLASQLAAQLAASGFRYGDVCVSLDCTLYTQHNLRSDFTEHKQIANTIMFDAEEALARDATEMALTFNISGSDDRGSHVTVFTADRTFLSTTLSELQGENLDPTAIEPDILCLARFLEHNFPLPKAAHPLFVILTGEACHMIHPQAHHQSPLVRSFIMGRSQNATSVLQREIPLTLAAMNLAEPIDAVFVAGLADAPDTGKLSETTGLQVHAMDLAALVGDGQTPAADDISPTEFAMAYGAALSEVKHIRASDFRQSFAPYQGKRLILQKTLRAISVMVTISMVVLGIYMQLKVFRKHNYISQLEKNLTEDYRTIMYGVDPPRNMPVLTKLGSVYSQVLKIRGGEIGDESSIPAKLTYMLQSINETPESIDVNIASIDVTGNRMSLGGDTNRRASTLALFNSFTAHPKLQKVSERLDQKGNRDVFTIDLELKKGKIAK
ncbi:MAG: hypothetical protein IH624_04500 [Phycisphaerae bacterium]|nr:hypothetical protein [Phycisphaerae bacterium]